MKGFGLKKFRNVIFTRFPPLKRGMLKYKIRHATRCEMLYGGVRLQSLCSKPPRLHRTNSSTVNVPKHNEEFRLLRLNFEEVPLRLMPLNMNHHARQSATIIRNKDVLRRYRLEREQRHILPRQQLSVVPRLDKNRSVDLDDDRCVFLPFQMMKPKNDIWAPASRGSGVRAWNLSLFQERLDGKGFGWKKKMRYLWQQDLDTKGFMPNRFY